MPCPGPAKARHHTPEKKVDGGRPAGRWRRQASIRNVGFQTANAKLSIVARIDHLECTKCGASIDAARPQTVCPKDGGVLYVRTVSPR